LTAPATMCLDGIPRPLSHRVAGSFLRARCLVLVIGLLAQALSASAATVVWKDVGFDWATASNWVSGIAPINNITTDTVQFGTVSSFQPVINTSRSIKGVTFTGSTATTLSGSGVLTLGTSGLVNSSTTGSATVFNALALGAASTFNNSGTLAVGGNINQGSFLLTLTGTGLNGTLAGISSGTGGLTKTGTGTWTLSGANTYSGATTITGGSLVLNNALALQASTLTAPSVGSLSFGNLTAATFGGLTGSANLSLLNNSSAGVAVSIGQNNATTTYSGILSGGGASLNKTGTGTLTLSGLNTFTGPVAIQAGTLSVNSLKAVGGGASALGAPTTVANGTLKLGSGTNAGALTYTGAATSTDRVIDLAGTTGGATLTASGTGALTFTSNLTTSGSGAKSLTFDGTSTAANTFQGTIADSTGGATALVKTGTGAWLLAGNNSFTGGLTLTAGTLTVGHDNALGTGTLKLAGGTLATNAARTLTNNIQLTASSSIGGTAVGPLKLTGIVSGGPNFNLTKASGVYLTLSNLNTYAGATAVTGGSLEFNTIADANGTASAVGAPTTTAAGTISIGSTTTAASLIYTGSGSTTNRVLNLAGTTGGATLTNNGTGALVFTSNLTATGLGAKTLTLSGTSTATSELRGTLVDSSAATSVTKSGTGLWQLSGANTYTGNTTLSAGTLVTGNNSAFGTGTLLLSGGTLRGDGTARTLANPVNLSASSTIGGASNLTFTGTLTNTQAGNPTLTVTNTGTTTFAAVNLSNSATNRTVTFSNTGNVNITGVIANGSTSTASALTKTGTGTLTLSGANTYTGATAVSAGALFVNGSLANTAVTVANTAKLGGSGTLAGLAVIQSGAHLAPGQGVGTLTFNKGLSLNAGSILDLELGTSSDLIRVSGGTLTGPGTGKITLNLFNSGGFTGGTYNLIDATGATLTSIGGTSFSLGTSIGGYTYNIVQSGFLFQLVATSAIPEPAAFAAMVGGLVLLGATLRRRPRALRG
jgi:autotransporter-associated beta strand protein